MNNIKETIVNVLFYILLCFTGILLLNSPQFGINFVRYYLGIILILSAGLPLYIFYVSGYKDYGNLLRVILLFAAGLFFLISQTGSAYALGLSLFIWMAASSLMKFILAYQYRTVFNQTWWVMVIFAAITLGCSIFIIMNIESSLKFIVQISAFYMIIEATLGILKTILFSSNKIDENSI